MFQNKSFLAIIPARGGSKRLPNKNILELAGKPLIAWTIEAALKSRYIDEVMVTTDEDVIIDIAERFGAAVPFKRPPELSSDTAGRTEVITHALDFYKTELKKSYDYIIYLQPTSPLRTAEHIDYAVAYMFEKKADAVISVCEVEHPVHWSGVLPNSMDMSRFLSDVAVNSRSQDLPVYYRLNGAIYICDTDKYRKNGCVFLKENIFAYVMPQEASIDIDTLMDFKIAEVFMEHK
ncbi:acylneuraminate cytidylyltransferase family protein [Geovibrio sp. ADMFC3]